MVCTFFHAGLNDCVNAYCYYPKNPEITCPRKKSFIDEKGLLYRESPETQSVTAQMQQKRYPKQY